MSFNTAIAKLMEFTNYFTKSDVRPRAAMEKLVLLLAPLAPHVAEELWQLLGHSKSLACEPWPVFDASAVKEDTIEVPVQINGKLRGGSSRRSAVRRKTWSRSRGPSRASPSCWPVKTW